MKPRVYWHIHHDQLFQYKTGTIKNRIAFIKREKPKEEIAIRLRLLKPVKGPLPVKLDKAVAARKKAWGAYVKAGAVYDKAGAACKPQLEALHKRECRGCPWNGETIFPKESA